MQVSALLVMSAAATVERAGAQVNIPCPVSFNFSVQVLGVVDGVNDVLLTLKPPQELKQPGAVNLGKYRSPESEDYKHHPVSQYTFRSWGNWYDAQCAKLSSSGPTILLPIPHTWWAEQTATVHVGGGEEECPLEWVEDPDEECPPGGGTGGGDPSGDPSIPCEVESFCIEILQEGAWVTVWCGEATVCG
jgi:hypothetical protein